MQIVPPVHLLQTLVVFAEQENLVQTAERLGLTQPTVSRQLQQLEELFDHPLFAQQGRNKTLTEYGKALATELKPRFLDLERVFQKIDHSFSSPRDLTLRMGGPYRLLETLTCAADFPGRMEITSMEDEQVEAALQQDQLDLAVTTTPHKNANWISKKIFTSVPTLIIPKKWARTIESAKDWAQVASNHPVAILKDDPSPISKFTDKYKLSLHINFAAEKWESLERRVLQQRSWSILPSHLLGFRADFVQIPLNNLFESETYYLSYKADFAQHSWMKDLIDGMLDF